MPNLPYEIVVPNPLPPHEPLVLAAAVDAETAQFIRRALEDRDGVPRDGYRVRIERESR